MDVEGPASGAFSTDDSTSRLLREAKALIDAGDLDGAIVTLQGAKVRMLGSSVSYPDGEWFRLPRLLQLVGRYDEAVQELEFLLDDLEIRAHKTFFVHDDSVRFAKPKDMLVKEFIETHRRAILAEKKWMDTCEQLRLSMLGKTK